MQNAADALQLLGYLLIVGALAFGLYLWLPGRQPPAGSGSAKHSPKAASLRSLEAWSELADRAEGYEPGHAKRVAKLARLLGEAIALPSEIYEPLEWAALLHDVGEVEFEAELLARQGPLERSEHWRLWEHSARGARKALELTRRQDVAQWVRWHHERWDGLGYPDGLSGQTIPLPARILSLADAADAMLQTRPYRAALDAEAVLEQINLSSAIAYDPVLARAFVDDVLPRYMAEQDAAWA